MLQAVLGRFLDWTVHDGISSELSTKHEQDYTEPAEFSNFIQIKPRKIDTREMKDFRAMALSPEKWGELEALMGGYFNDRINMFPYEGSLAASRAGPSREEARGSGDAEAPQGSVAAEEEIRQEPSGGLGIIKPDRFYRVQADMIERRFSGGRSRDIGDGDVRDLISCMRHVFAWNYWQLILTRRGWTLLGAVPILISGLLGIWYLANASSFSQRPEEIGPYGAVFLQVLTLSSAVALIGLISVVSYFLLLKRHNTLRYRYGQAVEISAANLRTSVRGRLQHIVSAMEEIYRQTESDEHDFRKDGKDWPEESKKWSVFGVWMSRRAEHIELFMQLEMWRIRRVHYGLRIMARWLSALVFVLTLLVFALLVSIGYGVGSVPRGIDLGAVLVAVAVAVGLGAIARSSFTAAIPDLNLIEHTLLTTDLPGHHNTQVQLHIANLIGRLIDKIVHLQGMLGRTGA